ncbi:MAG: hypothetical protein WBP64_17245 [Nitrososphaeraceae archaeon]
MNTRRPVIGSYFLIATVALLVRSTISYNSPNSFNLYTKSSNHDNAKNNDNAKITDSNTDGSNNGNLRTNDNTDSSATETNQIPVLPIVATSPVTSDPSMISVSSERNE